MKQLLLQKKKIGWKDSILSGSMNLLLILCFLFAYNNSASAQLQYVTSIVSESHVTDAQKSVDGNPQTYSELESSGGVLLGLGGYNSHIELSFPTVLPADQTIYVQIETEDGLLASLAGGTLGDLLSGLGGVVLVGNQEFDVEVKNGSTTVLSASSTNPADFAGERMRAVIDKDNNAFLIITPSQPFQSIKFTNKMGSLLGLGVKRNMKIYDPYYSLSNANCGDTKFTSFDGTGISLELLDLGGGVKNLDRAIDENLSSYSTLSLGVVSVASSLSQYVYFEAPTSPNDMIGFRFEIDPALLNIGISQSVDIKLKNGATDVSSQSLDSYLTQSNLNDLNNGQATTIYISPTLPIDRLIVYFHGILGVTVSQSLNVNEVFRIITPPDLDAFASDTIVCEGSSASVSATALDPSNEMRWYDIETGGSLIGITAPGASYTTGLIYSDTVVWVSSGIPGCPDESDRIPVAIQVIPAPTTATLSSTLSPYYCASDSIVVAVENTNGDQFGWYNESGMSNPIITGVQANGEVYSLTGDSLIITNLNPGDTTYSVFVAYQDSITGCWNMPGDEFEIEINVTDEPTPTTSATTQIFCESEFATVGDIDVNGGTINWYDENGAALNTSDILMDGANYYATEQGATCESSDSLAIAIQITSVPAPTTSATTQTFCESEFATVGDIDVNGGTINWYDENGNVLDLTDLLVDGATYFATEQDATCESADSLAIEVVITNTSIPTTDDTEQTFCGTTSTVADIDVNESDINWYDESGNLLNDTDLLVDGNSYYATLQDNACESTDTLIITITMETVPSPTTSELNQMFCSSDEATVADLTVNENDVNWYDESGNLLNDTDLLEDGATYYGTLQGMVCESEDSLAIEVSISSLPEATADETSQSFCEGSNPTIADLQVNETDVVWYDADGNLLDNSTLLIDGTTYYAAIVDGDCESTDLLAIEVTFDNLFDVDLTGLTQDICMYDTISYEVPTGMTDYSWVVTGGEVVSGGSNGDASVEVIWNDAEGGTLFITYINGNGCLIQTENAIDIHPSNCSDVTIEKTVNNLNPMIGEQVEFTIMVVNDGNMPVNGIVVDEQLQSGFTYVSHNASLGDYDVNIGEWTIPVLPGGDTA